MVVNASNAEMPRATVLRVIIVILPSEADAASDPHRELHTRGTLLRKKLA